MSQCKLYAGARCGSGSDGRATNVNIEGTRSVLSSNPYATRDRNKSSDPLLDNDVSNEPYLNKNISHKAVAPLRAVIDPRATVCVNLVKRTAMTITKHLFDGVRGGDPRMSIATD